MPQAEAERFVTRPFLMGSSEAPPPTPSPALSQIAAERVARAAGLESRKTTSIFTPAQCVTAPRLERAESKVPVVDWPLTDEGALISPTVLTRGLEGRRGGRLAIEHAYCWYICKLLHRLIYYTLRFKSRWLALYISTSWQKAGKILFEASARRYMEHSGGYLMQ